MVDFGEKKPLKWLLADVRRTERFDSKTDSNFLNLFCELFNDAINGFTGKSDLGIVWKCKRIEKISGVLKCTKYENNY